MIGTRWGSMESVSQRLRAARVLARVSVDQVAEAVGKSTRTVYAWEAGTRSVTLTDDEADALCKVLGCTTEWLREGTL